MRLNEGDQSLGMFVRAVIIQFAITVALAASASVAATKWTFCVASETAAKDVWITDVNLHRSGPPSRCDVIH